MIQLTEQQAQAVAADEYDDSPWTAAERDALAWEAGRHAGWQDMSEYDEEPIARKLKASL